MKKSNILILIVLIVLVALFIVYLVLQNNKSKDEAPLIHIDSESITVNTDAGYNDFMKGVTATDKEDGDVTNTILIESISPFDDNMQRTVTYVAFDSAKHVVHAQRTLKYSNYVSPVFKLGNVSDMTKWDEKTILSKINAIDILDGDLSENITITSFESIDYNDRTRLYTFNVKNSAGDSESVDVYLTLGSTSSFVPKIVLMDNLVYLETGAVIDPMQFYNKEESGSGIDGEEINIRYNSDVDTSVPGCYHIVYNASNSNKYETYAYLTVIVR